MRIFAIALAAAAPAQAATPDVPFTIPTQGRILDGNDQPVDGPATIEFAIYDEGAPGQGQVGHDPLWTQTHEKVTGGMATVTSGGTGIGIGGDLAFTGTLLGGTVPWARLSGRPTVSAGDGLTGGGAVDGSVSLAVNLATGTHAGSLSTVARGDHAHAWGALTGVPADFADGTDATVSFAGSDAETWGTASTAARSDHKHAAATGVLAVGSAVAGGSYTSCPNNWTTVLEKKKITPGAPAYLIVTFQGLCRNRGGGGATYTRLVVNGTQTAEFIGGMRNNGSYATEWFGCSGSAIVEVGSGESTVQAQVSCDGWSSPDTVIHANHRLDVIAFRK